MTARARGPGRSLLRIGRRPRAAPHKYSDIAALRVVGAHAAEPQTVFLRAVVDGKRVLLDEFLPLGGREPQRVAVALQVQEKLRAILVLPLARIHGAATQPDDDGQVLNAH